ncbi:MAG: SH3 domain-containing protein [Firmicutes bacterium]|nr:SH3 domain-containing protein [Bacillota bacterium]
MRFTEKRELNKVARSAVVCLLAFCVFAVSALASAPAEAASFSGKSPFTGKSYNHNSRYSGRAIVNGVDVSSWQSKNCNWSQAKAAGVDYAIMRVTYTNYGPRSLKLNNDSVFEKNFRNAKAAGVMTGVYVFSQAKNAAEGKKEAQFAVKRLKTLGITPSKMELPVYMDYEFAGGRLGRMYGISKTNATNAAVAFCNTIKSYGYTPGIYANTTFFRSYLDTSKFASDVDLWCAQYYSRCESGVNYSKWQYSSSARINGLYSYLGYKGNIDVNFWYVNKNVNKKPLTVIKGRTTLSVKDAKNPKFTITNGKTTLKQGTDYIVAGIRNNRKGSAYAYIKGIGKYGGYALVPIKVANKTSGSTTTALNSKSANYLTYANKKYSSYAGATKVTLKKGKTYQLTDYMNVRQGPGTNYGKIKVLNKGTNVSAYEVKGNWIRIGSGRWICGQMDGEVYVK